MTEKKDKKIIIFTDGASKGNPGPGGYGAVLLLPEGEVIELGGREDHTTNNRMELSGAIKALKEISKREENILIYTDSKYLIGGMTAWIHNWQKNDWKKRAVLPNGKIKESDVLNQDLWKDLAKFAEGKEITWNYVAGHIGIAGNERCDEIASGLATGEEVLLYKGSLKNYKINILDLAQNGQ